MMKLWTMAVAIAIIAGCSGTRPSRLGVTNGKFTPCPGSPNCVCSQAQDGKHAIAPLSYQGTPAQAWARLIAVIQGVKRAKIVTSQECYLHAEFTSAVFRFVDDGEFYLDDGQKVIHVRSASRLGSFDYGVNRKRLENIRRLFNQTSP